MYFVYALYSPKYSRIYIGLTSSLEGRLEAHNHPANKGWTAKYQPWVLIYSEPCPSKTEALRREKQLKSAQGRAFVRGLIQ
jgi:putative endonuclease